MHVFSEQETAIALVGKPPKSAQLHGSSGHKKGARRAGKKLSVYAVDGNGEQATAGNGTSSARGLWRKLTAGRTWLVAVDAPADPQEVALATASSDAKADVKADPALGDPSAAPAEIAGNQVRWQGGPLKLGSQQVRASIRR